MVQQRQGWRRVIPEPHATWERENKCPQCGKIKSEWKRRTDWRCCSTECSALFFHDKVIHSWAEIREKALCRDDWRCVRCGVQPTTIIRNGYQGSRKVLKRYYDPLWRGEMAVVVEGLVGDHIVPIALGGEEFSLKNIQTLCGLCHKSKTADDVKRIARLRIIEKKLSGGQRKLSEGQEYL